jgi:hypothetical protein
VVLAQRLRASESGLDASTLVGGDAAGEKAGINAQALREPLDRFLGRASLATLDLADVLLREALTGEIGLGQTRADAQRSQAFAEASVGRSSEAGCFGGLSRSSQVENFRAAESDT